MILAVANLDSTGIGRRFGKWRQLTASFKLRGSGNGNTYTFAVCECGTIKRVRLCHLESGNSRGCHPCLKTHGKSGSSEYKCYHAMIERCYLESCEAYANYGARGISVCQRWRESFENFYADMGNRPSSKHSLDRINNNGNYEPSNCRWAVSKTQAGNRRNNRHITYDGRTQTLTEWSEETGIKIPTLYSRLEANMPLDKVFSDGTHKVRLLTHNGKTQSLKEWSNEIGIKQTTIGERLSRGWTIAEALSPAKKRAKRR